MAKRSFAASCYISFLTNACVCLNHFEVQNKLRSIYLLSMQICFDELVSLVYKWVIPSTNVSCVVGTAEMINSGIFEKIGTRLKSF